MNATLWLVAGVLAALYLYAGVLKTFQYEKAKARLKWPADLPRGLVAGIGISELLGGLGLVLPLLTGVLPWLTPLAASGIVVIMLLATAFHVKRREYPAAGLTLLLAALAAYVASGRWHLIPL